MREIERKGKKVKMQGAFQDFVQVGDIFDDYTEEGKWEKKKVVEKIQVENGVYIVSVSEGEKK